jgi:hypothetical protein
MQRRLDVARRAYVPSEKAQAAGTPTQSYNAPIGCLLHAQPDLSIAVQ